jgi:hypothetical protein
MISDNFTDIIQNLVNTMPSSVISLNKSIEQPIITNTNIPAININTNTPAININTNIPAININTNTPAININTNTPAININTNIPAININTNTPAINTNTNIPAININTNTPAININTNIPAINTNTNKFFYPKEKDSLFWCFYIIHNGITKYEMLFNRNEIIEKQLKIEYVEKLRKDKSLVKKCKFDTLTNIETNLVNDFAINIYTFLILCAFENIDIIILNQSKKTYYESIIDETKERYLINVIDKPYITRYGFELNKNVNKYLSYYKIENIKKPIKAIANYTLKDLIEISCKLNIDLKTKDTNKPKLKKELYEDVIKYFIS